MNNKDKIKNKEQSLQDAVSDYYEDMRYKNPISRQWHDRNIRRMISLIDEKNLKGRFFDNGCGVGLLGDFLPKKRIIGSDISLEMLKKAIKIINQVVQADSEKLPFKDEEFDVIFTRSLLHHLPSPEMAVSECYRTLKPGGQIVFQDTLLSIFSYLPRKIANWEGEHFNESHRNYKRGEIIGLVKEKFIIEEIYYSGYLAYLLGFPDIMDVTKYIPLKKVSIPTLYWLDRIIEKTPILKRQSWGIIIAARKN